jgi:hypothetical protein
LEIGKESSEWGNERIEWMNLINDTISKLNVNSKDMLKNEPSFSPLKEVLYMKKLMKSSVTDLKSFKNEEEKKDDSFYNKIEKKLDIEKIILNNEEFKGFLNFFLNFRFKRFENWIVKK